MFVINFFKRTSTENAYNITIIINSTKNINRKKLDSVYIFENYGVKVMKQISKFKIFGGL